MNTPIQVNELLEKPMDRREFLKNVGIAGLFVMGGGTIVRSIVDFMYQQKQPRQVRMVQVVMAACNLIIFCNFYSNYIL